MSDHENRDPMREDPLDVTDWPAPEPPDGFADGVLAALDRDDARKRRRRFFGYASVTAVLAAGIILRLTFLVFHPSPSPRPDTGDITAEATREIEIAPGAMAVLERYAHVVWSAAGVVQDRGDVFYRLAPGVHLDVRTPTGGVSSEGSCSRVKVVPSTTGPATTLVAVSQGEVEIRGTTDRIVLAAGRYARVDPDRVRTDADDSDGSMAYALAIDRVRTYVEALPARAASSATAAPSATARPPVHAPSAPIAPLPSASVAAAPSASAPKRIFHVPRCECPPGNPLCGCLE